MRTNQALPSEIMTPKSMTFRDAAYLKVTKRFLNGWLIFKFCNPQKQKNVNFLCS